MKLIEPAMIDLLMLCQHARPDEIAQYEALVGEWNVDDAAAEIYMKRGYKFALINDNGVPVCAGGWDLVIEGVYHSWMVGTMEYWDQYWRSITKYSRRIMDNMLLNGARRLQTGVLADRTEACNWYVKGLRMHPEGVYRNYGRNGEDLAMYARLKESENG